jgi:serine phosphatase RsbU (regulator of sigma subunit)
LFEASGPPVGVIPGELWQDEHGTMDIREMMLLYTDGIVEARAATTQVSSKAPVVEYQQEGLETLLSDLADLTPKDLIAAVLEDVASYTAPLPPHDDCTMIALRYRGNG